MLDNYQLTRLAEAIACSPLGAAQHADICALSREHADAAFAARCHDIAAALIAEGERRAAEPGPEVPS